MCHGRAECCQYGSAPAKNQRQIVALNGPSVTARWTGHGDCRAAPGNGRRRSGQAPGQKERVMKHLRILTLVLAAVAGSAVALAVPAQAQTKLKMVLNWKYQGPQGWFFLADDRGYFKAEGLEMVIDQGNGSGAGVPLVANGAYDVAFGDLNALIELAAKKPDDAPIAVYVMYNRPPFTVAVKADSPIRSPKDLEGKTLGGAANDGALKLFPAFCKIAKIDCDKVKITNMQPNLR